jgi:signal transduction histidine kinase
VDFNAVAHDLRTPLNVMLAHMQLLAVEGLSETGRRRLGVLETQIRRMMRLLDSCSGQQTEVTCAAPVDLNEVIRNVVTELDAMLNRRGAEIRFAVPESLPCVHGDADLLHRVLLNLLVNAADSIDDAGRIQIAAQTEFVPHSDSGTVQIEIVDTGVGIPPDLVALVFDRGFTTKAGGKTHGFGLGICREIIQMHGGTIHLSSVPGEGTTVRLTLPIDARADQRECARPDARRWTRSRDDAC